MQHYPILPAELIQACPIIHIYSICMYLATTNTEAFAAPNVEQATISGIITDPASPIVLYPNG